MLFAYLLLALELSNRVDADAEEAQYSCDHGDGEMVKRVRRAATGIHNKWRSVNLIYVDASYGAACNQTAATSELQNYQAKGKVGIAPDFGRNYPTAADMLAMTYNCSLEKKAREQNLCKIRYRTSFTDTDRNYDYLSAENFVTEEGAMILAGDRWFDQFLYSRTIKNVTPEAEDFATLPFFIMIKGDTPTVGCHVKLCDSTNGKNYAVLCYYEQPHVKVGEPLYKDGKPCSECPSGYQCKGEKKLCKKD